MRAVPRFMLPLAAAVFGMLAVQAAQAQGQVRSARNPQPSPAARAAQGAPSPNGLRSPFPAGLTSGSGAAVAADPVARNSAITSPSVVDPDPTDNAPVPGRPGSGGVQGPVQGGTPPDTTVLGGAPGFGVVRGPSASVPLGGAGFSAVDIARSFLGADGNGDGELTRGEAARLQLSVQSFEEMDRDFDGVITRGEYEDGLR